MFICFSNVDVRLWSFNFFSHKKFFIKRFHNLVFYKIDLLMLKFKSPLLKPKFNLLNQIIEKNLQRSYKSFSTNFFDQHDIKVTLHKYLWQNWHFFGLLTWFLACLTMIAPFQCFVHEVSYVLCLGNGWLVGSIVELFMMFGKDGYQFTIKLSPIFYYLWRWCTWWRGEDKWKWRIDRKWYEELNIHELLHCVF